LRIAKVKQTRQPESTAPIIDDHDGKIWVENKPDGGAKFSFSFENCLKMNKADSKIFIVDDDEEIRSGYFAASEIRWI
ncbi:MAG: hypothetical protein MZV64_09030, partial [Ignavibacteriales bacterium]|nr:hypothetical protein [Ignavibacteriales bacterium]